MPVAPRSSVFDLSQGRKKREESQKNPCSAICEVNTNIRAVYGKWGGKKHWFNDLGTLFQYVSALETTPMRREKLKSGWYFDCKCGRCTDPTENESFASATR